MNKDIHQHLGPKVRMKSMQDCLDAVRQSYPKAYMEGSTGFERSFWVKQAEGNILIGHAWPIRRSEDFWLRVSQVA